MGAYSSAIGNKVTEKYNKGLYEEALTACRRGITWYILSHKAHTEPWLASKGEGARQLLKIDIEALGESLDLLRRCYYKTGEIKSFPLALRHLADAVDDSRWRDKILYFQALWWFLDNLNQDRAFSVISKIDIENCQDPEILALYINICPETVPFTKQAEILDRVVLNTQKPSYKLQYSMLKGIAHCLINEIDQGCRIIKNAIDDYAALEGREKSDFGNYQLAHALQVLGQFTNEGETLERAVAQYTEIVVEAETNEYADSYFAEIKKSLGDCMAALRRYDEAVNYYTASLGHQYDELTKVFMAKAYTNTGDLAAARRVLESTEIKDFDDNAHYDYAIAWTNLALHSLIAEDHETAKAELRKAKSPWPLFTAERDSALIEILETTPLRSSGRLRTLIQRLNRYVVFQPKIFGMGVNLNTIIEDLAGEEGGMVDEQKEGQD